LRELLNDLKDEVAENVGTVTAALEAKALVCAFSLSPCARVFFVQGLGIRSSARILSL